MDRKQEFSVASKRDEDQKRLAEDQERMRQIDKIRDQQERNHHRQGMELRDEKLKIEKERADREERTVVQREVEKKMADKHELHLTMKGVEGLSPEKKRDMIEKMVSHNVRISHGAELDQHRAEVRTDMNREIDKGIKQSLEKQERHQNQEAKPSLKKPWQREALGNENDRPWTRDNDGLERKP